MEQSTNELGYKAGYKFHYTTKAHMNQCFLSSSE